jgi:hypothetical protein
VLPSLRPPEGLDPRARGRGAPHCSLRGIALQRVPLRRRARFRPDVHGDVRDKRGLRDRRFLPIGQSHHEASEEERGTDKSGGDSQQTQSTKKSTLVTRGGCARENCTRDRSAECFST